MPTMTHAHTHHITLPFIGLLLLGTGASFIAVLLAPAIPAIAHYFQVTQTQAELVVSLYLVGYGVGQLIHGVTANRYGRKNALLLGVGFALVAVLLSILAASQHWFYLFVASRLLTALGISAGLVTSMIMISDTQTEKAARKTFSGIVLGFALVPFIAISLGGYLTTHFNWISALYIEIYFTLLLLFIIPSMPETLHPLNRKKVAIKHLLSSYAKVVQNISYVKYVLLYAIGGTVSYIFNALAPIIATNDLHVSPQQYGLTSVLSSLGILLGGFLSNRYAQKTSAAQMIYYGIAIIFASNLVLLLLFITAQINLLTLFLTASIMFLGTGLIVPNASMKAVSMSEDHATAAAVMNSGGLILISLMVTIAGSFIGFSSLSLPISQLIITAASYVILKSISR